MVKIAFSLRDIFTFFILLVLIIFVYSLLGVELFSYSAKVNLHNEVVPNDDPDGFSPQFNFDTFFNGMITVFVCLMGEDWQLVMHVYIQASQSRILPSLYFISLMVIGNMFLMNLFLAILLKNFEVNEESQDISKKGNQKKKRFFSKLKKISRSLSKIQTNMLSLYKNNAVTPGAKSNSESSESNEEEGQKKQQTANAMSEGSLTSTAKKRKGAIVNSIDLQLNP